MPTESPYSTQTDISGLKWIEPRRSGPGGRKMPVLAPLWQFYCPPTPVCFPSCVTCAAIFCMACASSAGEWILKFVPSSARGSAGSPRVLHNLYDHTSILKLLEWRWKPPTLTTHDASDRSLI